MESNETTVQRDRVRQRSGAKKDKVKPPTKIIIRHLPPTMTEDEFLEQVDPLPDNDFYYFVSADWSLGNEATCRAYVNVKHFEDVYGFRDRFDGYVFVDTKGAEYSAIVEFAPFQGMLKNKSRRTDNKVGRIEEEPHYQQFLLKMDEEREAASKSGENKLEFTLDQKKDDKITSTPLLQYLAIKKEKRREEAKKRVEEKRRQRDEDKRHVNIRQSANVQIASKDQGASKNDAKSSTSGRDNVGEKGDSGMDERKNSRSKRRTERDQRRREEHEQRKKERQRVDRAQKEVAANAGDATNNNRKVSFEAGKVDENKPKPDVAETKQRNDGKKFKESNRRNRNRKGSGENAGIKSQSSKANAAEKNAPVIRIQQKDPNANVEQKGAAAKEEEEVNDTVRSFIRSIVQTKEFVPRDKQEGSKSSEQNADDETERKATITPTTIELPNVAEEEKKPQTNEAKTGDETRKLERQRSAEERRIRNKNRPSIAIYQPKPRTQRSEESDSFVGGAQQSNECEKTNFSKEDEPRPLKRNARYSEQRAERRRQKAAAKDSDTARETKSCEKDNVAQDGKEIVTECGASSSEV